MTSIEITPTLRLTVVKHLANGKDPDTVATITKLPRSAVVDIGADHGYPNTDNLRKAASILTRNLEQANAPQPGQLTQGTPDADGTTNLASGFAVVPPTTTLTQPDEIRVLINTAKGHPAKRIQNAANKVLDDIARLRDLIKEDQDKNAVKRKANEAKAAARAEVARLEEQLRAAKAKLRGSTTPKAPKSTTATPGNDPSPAQIRAWAAENGVECNSHGRVPQHVVEAYTDAHVQAAS